MHFWDPNVAASIAARTVYSTYITNHMKAFGENRRDPGDRALSGVLDTTQGQCYNAW
jgi:hypothetical protein